MHIYTTYYAKLRKLPRDITPISISRCMPKNMIGDIKTLPILAPTSSILNEFKITGNETWYTERYKNEILSKLDPNYIYDVICTLSNGKDVALVCYESSNKFCHRHLVREWLIAYGYQVSEF